MRTAGPAAPMSWKSPPLVVMVDLVVWPASAGEARAARSGHGDLAAELRESLSGYLADRVVSAWQIGPDAGSVAQIADDGNAAADGIPAFVTGPVTRPIAKLGTLIEIAGVIIGIVANIHPLALACANRLAKEKITDLVAERIAEVMDSLASATTVADASAEEATASQLGLQDPASIEPSAQHQLNAVLDASRIEPEVQDPRKILEDAAAGDTSQSCDAAENATTDL